MGAYLSKPITDKISTDEEDDKIKIGASSMQGWRETQEDAHNSILDFDDNTYFFAVYDGHGGREVALYCSQNLPEFIKSTDAYKSKDFDNALIDGFLGFDATLTSDEVIDKLKTLIEDSTDQNDVSDEENVNKLYEEASMPLDEVIEKYKLVSKALKGVSERIPLSPYLKACKSTKENCEGVKENENTDTANKNVEENSDLVASPSSASSCKGDIIRTKDVLDGEENTSESAESRKCKSIDTDVSLDVSGPDQKDSEGTNENLGENINNSDDKCLNESKTVIEDEKNTIEIKSNLNEDDTINTKPQENGKISKIGRGKVSAKTKGVVTTEKKVRPKRTAKQLYLELLESESESQSEDEEDKTFQGPLDNSSSDEDMPNIPSGESDESSDVEDIEDEEDLDESEDEFDEDEEYDDGQGIDLEHDVPGSSSGCTAVVALMHGTKLFVANAGDSRCIVCRNGRAIDMSVDHKPEDAEEYERIKKAGGRVNSDGRVNGGLNLSRAIGDHSYKLNKDLPDREQMITALPDIKTHTLTSSDEFMVLACDGIWNYMSSQEVADFVKCRLDKTPEKVSQICEELFDNCLASNTLGDGTGCDNMTAIIISFKNSLFKRSAPSDDEESTNLKRAKTDEGNNVQETAV